MDSSCFSHHALLQKLTRLRRERHQQGQLAFTPVLHGWVKSHHLALGHKRSREGIPLPCKQVFLSSCQRAENGALDPSSLDLRLVRPRLLAPNHSQTPSNKGFGASGLKTAPKRRSNDDGPNAPFSAFIFLVMSALETVALQELLLAERAEAHTVARLLEKVPLDSISEVQEGYCDKPIRDPFQRLLWIGFYSWPGTFRNSQPLVSSQEYRRYKWEAYCSTNRYK